MGNAGLFHLPPHLKKKGSNSTTERLIFTSRKIWGSPLISTLSARSAAGEQAHLPRLWPAGKASVWTGLSACPIVTQAWGQINRNSFRENTVFNGNPQTDVLSQRVIYSMPLLSGSNSNYPNLWMIPFTHMHCSNNYHFSILLAKTNRAQYGLTCGLLPVL